MSIHNEARKGDIAKTVLLPGDPLRAKYIADTFLENPVCYNNVRGMLGFTGSYKGKKISVQGSGMGMPSMSIYAQELIEEYDVENLIRIGTCGTFQENIHCRDVILAQSASTDSQMNKIRFLGNDFAPAANFGLLLKAYQIAREKNIPVHVGNILSSDFFYNDDHLGDTFMVWKKYGTLAVEMETSALYTLAARFNRKALAILTVSDHIIKGEKASSHERQNSFRQMIEIALELG